MTRDSERLLLQPGFDVDAQPVGERARRRFFDGSHPLAAAAARLCRRHGPPGVWPVMSQVACGPCWTAAIRADERVVAECGLSRELVADPDLVDETAVRLALADVPVELTRVERAAVAARRATTPVAVPQFHARGRLLRPARASVQRLDSGLEPAPAWVHAATVA